MTSLEATPDAVTSFANAKGIKVQRDETGRVKVIRIFFTAMSNEVKQGSVFNVGEAQGAERVQYETTAAHAQAEAPTSDIAHQVEENAEHIKEAADKVAQTAKGMGPEMTGEPPVSDIDVLKREAANKTNAAVIEGKSDFDTAKATSASHLDQAKSTAGSLFTSTQDFVRGAVHGHGPESSAETTESSQTRGRTDDVLGSLQSTAKSAVETTQEYLASAQATVQPQLQSARETLESQVAGAKAAIQPHVEKARKTAQGYLGMGSKPDVVTPSGEKSSDLPVGEGDVPTATSAGKAKLESEVA